MGTLLSGAGAWTASLGQTATKPVPRQSLPTLYYALPFCSGATAAYKWNARNKFKVLPYFLIHCSTKESHCFVF